MTAHGRASAEVDHLLGLYKCGEAEPIPVELPPLPENATEPMRRVADFYKLVAGLRAWAGWPDDDNCIPMASKWTGDHLGLHEMTVWRALVRLVKAGVLVHGDPLDGRYGHETHTFMPGTVGD